MSSKSKVEVEPAPNRNGEKTPVEWSKIQPEEIPAKLLDDHPRVRDLVARVQELERDVLAHAKGQERLVKHLRAIRELAEPLDDTLTLVRASLSPRTQVLLGMRPPEPSSKPAAPA